ncbi:MULTISPECIES: DedA family protein [Exiguobacterium]|uniref:DedA family protein n=1 Tax=Exiguobacterium alkaliphilum TaxID=1428684 RepID=A0ABT2L100_9BACL|nr:MULTISPECIES: DedA family protein [Exiguobacterium]MCT4796812.1 DedA family protein [Exiguobacterium alkaliphilum]QUE85258.1 DedA family protein [Exiguobacterium alkaliphilum]
MRDWMIGIIEQFGYVGIAFMIFIENVFPPIPSEVVLLFGGFFAVKTDLMIWLVIVAATVGAIAGAVLLYGIGLYLDVEQIEKWTKKYGKWIRLDLDDVHKADAWFDRYGGWMVFFGRLMPVVRSLISLPAGMSNMPFVKFLLLSTAGTLIWNSILIFIGIRVGENWESILRYLDVYSYAIYALLAVGLILYFIWRKRRKQKKSKQASSF